MASFEGKAGFLACWPQRRVGETRFPHALSAVLLGTTALFTSAIFASQPAAGASNDLFVGPPPIGSVYNVSGTEAFDAVYVGNVAGETGTLNILGGAQLNTGPGDSVVGSHHGASGTVIVSGPGSRWTGTGDSVNHLNYLANEGSAVLTITDGGSVVLNRAWLAFGREADASNPAVLGDSTLTVQGIGSSFETTGDMLIGRVGNASVTVSDGAVLRNDGVAIGGWEWSTGAEGSGSLTVTGSGTSWINSAGVSVGLGGNATASLEISNGANATIAAGVYGGSNANVLITGNDTSVTIGDKSDVESTSWFNFGGGDITVSDGAYLYSDGGYIGGTKSTPTSTTMTVTGAGTVWETTKRIFVANNAGGNGKLVISDGATVSSATFVAGLDTGSTGQITISGADTSVHAYAIPELDYLGNFYVGYEGEGIVTVSSGASLTVDNELRIATEAAGTGTLNIGADKDSTAVAAGAITAQAIVFGEGNGQVIFNHTDTDYVLSAAVSGSGTLEALSGTTHLAGDFSGFTGGVSIEGGTLYAESGSFTGTSFTANSSTLQVSGAVSGVAEAVNMSDATLVNSGSISGNTYGVVLNTGGNTVTNTGAISGGVASVYYQAGENRLNIQPSASFDGVVDFNNTTGNTTAFGSGSYSIPVAHYLTADNTIELNNDKQSVVYSTPASTGAINVINASAVAASSAAPQSLTAVVGVVMTDILTLDVDRNGPVYSPVGSGVALGYAEERSKTEGETAIATLVGDGLALDPYGNLTWMRAFGGQKFDSDNSSTAGHYGLAFGLDHVFDDTRLGLMGGIGRSVSRKDDGSSDVSGDIAFTGLYARHNAGPYHFDASLIAGGIFSTSQRQIIISGGTETANGDFSGWFASPEVAVSGDYDVAPGWVFTPKGVLRYTHGAFAGYSETGSSQNITYGERSTDALQAALEMKIANHLQLANGQALSTSVTATVLDTYNLGNNDFNASLQGTDFTISSSSARNVVGGKLGVSAELKLSPQATVFAGANAGLYSDNTWDYAANAGFKLKF